MSHGLSVLIVSNDNSMRKIKSHFHDERCNVFEKDVTQSAKKIHKNVVQKKIPTVFDLVARILQIFHFFVFTINLQLKCPVAI
jgi:hypothetical protein